MTKTHFTPDTSDKQVTLLSKDDLYLFNEGTHFHLFDKLGAHPLEHNGVERNLFCRVGAQCGRGLGHRYV